MTLEDKPVYQELARLAFANDAYEIGFAKGGPEEYRRLAYVNRDGMRVVDPEDRSELEDAILTDFVEGSRISKAGYVSLTDVPGIAGLRLQWHADTRRLLARFFFTGEGVHGPDAD